MKKPNISRSNKKIKNIKKKAWFRPLSAMLLLLVIILLVLGSASVSRISARRQRQSFNFTNKMENTSAGGENAYDFFDNTNKSSNTRNGMMVTLGNLYDTNGNSRDYAREVLVTGDENDSDFFQGTAGMLESLEQRIKESLFGEMESHYSEVIEGATGKNGEQGEQGERGESGPRGQTGAVGKTGATGQSGSVGATGAQGETGEAGKDGLSTFIAYADNSNGDNMGATPKETSKYIGTYQGTIRSSDPKDYTWTEYKDKIITYVNDGQPTLKIFN